MATEKLDIWWSTLTVKEKVRIATKIARISNPDAPEQNYPDCTDVWQNSAEELKVKVYEHCTDDHGLLIPKWQEGFPQSY